MAAVFALKHSGIVNCHGNLLLPEYLKDPFHLIRHPDIILIRQKNITPSGIGNCALYIFLNPLARTLQKADLAILLFIFFENRTGAVL